MSFQKLKLLSDNELVHRFIKGKSAEQSRILTHIWERYHLYVFKDLSKNYRGNLPELEIEEALSDAYQKLPELLLSNTNPAPEKHKLRAFLYKIGSNECIDRIRSQNTQKRAMHKQTVDITDFFMEKDVYLSALSRYEDESLALEEEHILLTDVAKLALGLLSEQQKQCLILQLISDYSYEQIATELNLAFDQVRSSIFNGKKRLKQIIAAGNTVAETPISKPQLRLICEQLQIGGNLQPLTPSVINISLSLLPEKEAIYMKEHLLLKKSLIEMTEQFNDKRLRETLLNAQKKLNNILQTYQEVDARLNIQ